MSAESKPIIGGRPACHEHRGLWLYDAIDAPTSQEYEQEVANLEAWIAMFYQLDRDVYVRGDFYGDRTQYVEIVDHNVLGVDFVNHLQGWLRSSENYRARIVLPNYTALGEKGSVMIYVDCLKFGVGDGSLESALKAIVKERVSKR